MRDAPRTLLLRWHEVAEELRQRAELAHELARPFRVVDRRLDLAAVPDDAFVPEQLRDLPFAEARDLLEVEAPERAPEVLALAEDRQPRQAGLETLEADLLEEPVVVGDSSAPLVVVVAQVVGVSAVPPTALLPIVADDEATSRGEPMRPRIVGLTRSECMRASGLSAGPRTHTTVSCMIRLLVCAVVAGAAAAAVDGNRTAKALAFLVALLVLYGFVPLIRWLAGPSADEYGPKIRDPRAFTEHLARVRRSNRDLAARYRALRELRERVDGALTAGTERTGEQRIEAADALFTAMQSEHRMTAWTRWRLRRRVARDRALYDRTKYVRWALGHLERARQPTNERAQAPRGPRRAT